MKDIIEIIDAKDNRLTDDFINEVRFFGSKDCYTYKDYLYISEIWHGDRLVAKIHNRESKRYKVYRYVLSNAEVMLSHYGYMDRSDFESTSAYFDYLVDTTAADSAFMGLRAIEDGAALRWALYNIAYDC